MNDSIVDEVRFDADLIARYDGRGPRYTSYPTAPQFADTFAAKDYRKFALESNSSERPLSLYVHIPFCQSLCYYCGCNKIVTRNQQRISNYLDHLHREIDMQAELFADSRQVEQLHFGGGTPTYLDDNQLIALMDKLAGKFSFASPEDREFSIEVDPRSVTAASIRLLADLGFNRLSLGIQDFDNAVQIAVNRVQSETDVADLVETARAEGFKSISFDLIYGLPQQTIAGFEQTLRTVVDMRPDRLAVYNYAHLPERFKGQRMIQDDQIPLPETKLEILHLTIDRLCAAGYHYVGMDHFALPDDELVQARHKRTLQRNFQGYSTNKQCDLVGLGVSSISHVGNSFSQNAATTMAYEALIEEDRLPVCRGIAIDDDDIIRANAIQELMCYDRLDFSDFDERYGVSVRSYFAAEIKRLTPMIEDGLVTVADDGIYVTARGRMLVRNIAMTFDRHLGQAGNAEQFSKAI
ncbi:MAG: oxygen-independent coproporphyrinogen III oxidase [Woeseiaceae bacterium]